MSRVDLVSGVEISLVSCVCLVSEVEIGLVSWGQSLDKIEGLPSPPPSYSLYEQFQDSFFVGVHIIFFVPIG